MAVRFASARIDERGKASGGQAGDQTGKEVSIQDWYKHSKGWIVIRPKSNIVAEEIAQDMEWACDNPNIGYDQNERLTLYNAAKKVGFNCSKVTTRVETDCSALVRVCLAYAGIMVGNFTTSGEVTALEKTGQFEILREAKYTDSPDYLKRGYILETKTTGHTGIILDNGSKIVTEVMATKKPVLRLKSLSGTYTTTGKLNLRNGAGTENKVLVVLPKGTLVHCYGYYGLSGLTKWLWIEAKVNGIKYTVQEPRPGSGARNSFPSGHTATAFTGAELIRLEYGNGYGIAAYGITTAGVALMRLYNDRHWLNDIVAGAGIGILSANIAYWMLPWERKLFGWDNSSRQRIALMPTYNTTFKQYWADALCPVLTRHYQ